MKSELKKGIKGQMYIPLNDESDKYFVENIEVFKAVFKAVCNCDFEYCAFETYYAEYQDKEVIAFDFDIRDRTFKEADASFSRFKKEIKNHFGYKPEVVFIGKYDRV